MVENRDNDDLRSLNNGATGLLCYRRFTRRRIRLGWNGRQFPRFVPNPKNPRTHSKKQIKQIAASIRKFGFLNPLIVDDENMVLAGHGRLKTARLEGLTEVPIVRSGQLTEAQKRAYLLADNKIALNAGWDEELLALELKELLSTEEFDVELTGFSIAEVDRLIDGLAPEEPGDPADDEGADQGKAPSALSPRRRLAHGTSPAHLRRRPRS